MRVDHRCFDVAMPQELLNRSNVIAAFKDVCGKACRNEPQKRLSVHFLFPAGALGGRLERLITRFPLIVS